MALGRDGNPAPAADRMLRGLEGIVLLDGTWSQAKTLWWRNPWLLKLQRIVLNPPGPARLGRLRREPRQEALSTLEAASLVLRHTEPGPEAADALLAALDRLIAACGGSPPPLAPAVPTLPRALSPTAFRDAGVGIAVYLQPSDAQPGNPVPFDGALPGEEFLGRDIVALADFLEVDETGAHGLDDHRFAPRHPSFGVGRRQRRVWVVRCRHIAAFRKTISHRNMPLRLRVLAARTLSPYI